MIVSGPAEAIGLSKVKAVPVREIPEPPVAYKAPLKVVAPVTAVAVDWVIKVE